MDCAKVSSIGGKVEKNRKSVPWKDKSNLSAVDIWEFFFEKVISSNDSEMDFKPVRYTFTTYAPKNIRISKFIAS